MRKMSSLYFGIDVSKTQCSIISSDKKDLVLRSIIQYAGGDGARLTLAKRNLDSLGFINDRHGSRNDQERLKCTKTRLRLIELVAEIKRVSL